jgi:hypothetical protein
MNDEKYCQQVIEELRSAPPRESLWLKALTLKDGNERNGRIQYVKWRVDQLLQEDRQKQNNQPPLPYKPTETDKAIERIIFIFGRTMLVISRIV